MVPLLDMVNHYHPQSNAHGRDFKLEVDQGEGDMDRLGLTIRKLPKVKKGQEVTFTYTMDYDSPMKLLAGYGFTV